MWIERLMAGISHQHVLSYNPKETSDDLLKVFFYCTEAIPEPRVQVFAPLRSAQSTRPPDELRPIFRIIKERVIGQNVLIETAFSP